MNCGNVELNLKLLMEFMSKSNLKFGYEVSIFFTILLQNIQSNIITNGETIIEKNYFFSCRYELRNKVYLPERDFGMK
ncbi:unnamed protein product [Rhizophagus irregularis]|nr:unnamed protein product [Rhizophagus irregularis]